MEINAEFIVAFLKNHPGIIKSLYRDDEKEGMDESVLYNPDDWCKPPDWQIADNNCKIHNGFPSEWHNYNWTHDCDGIKAFFGYFGTSIADDLCIDFGLVYLFIE